MPVAKPKHQSTSLPKGVAKPPEDIPQKTNNKKGYSFFKDRKMIGIFCLLLAILFLVFSFIDIPVLTTIHAYTIGMFVGFYSPLFYLFIVCYSLWLIFGARYAFLRIFYANKIYFLSFILLIVFISVTSGYYQASEDNWLTIGAKPWSAFNNWFDEFTSRNDAFFPNPTNGGLVGAFSFALYASAFSGVGAFLSALATAIWLVLKVLNIFYSGFFDFKNKRTKTKLVNKQKKENDQSLDREDEVIEKIPSQSKLNNVNKNENTQEDTQDMNSKPTKSFSTKEELDETLPFDDPFGV